MVQAQSSSSGDVVTEQRLASSWKVPLLASMFPTSSSRSRVSIADLARLSSTGEVGRACAGASSASVQV